MKAMGKRWKIAIGGLAVAILIAVGLLLNGRLNAGGTVSSGKWHYDQLLVYTKMWTINHNTNPFIRNLYIFDTANNREKKLPGIVVGAVGKIAYSPATKIIAYSKFKLKNDNTPNYNSCTLELYDVSTFRKLDNLGPSVNEPSGCSTPLSWSPDGSIMIFKHFIDYDYYNFVTRYMVLEDRPPDHPQVAIKKIGLLDDVATVDEAFGWYDPKAFVASPGATVAVDFVKVTFPAPLYNPVTQSIPGSGNSSNSGKIVFDNSNRNELLYSLTPANYNTVGRQISTIPLVGGSQHPIQSTRDVQDFILMKYGVDQNGGTTKQVVYRQSGQSNDPTDGFYKIDPNSYTKSLIASTNDEFESITDFLSFDSGISNRFYFRVSGRKGQTAHTSSYVRQSTKADMLSEVILAGLSETEL